MDKEPDARKVTRFHDTVDIREIPNKNAESPLLRSGAQPQPALKTTRTCETPKVCKTQQNILIGIVLICVIIATIGRIVLSKEEKSTAKNSRTRDCDDPSQYWNATDRACTSRLKYQQRCRTTDNCLPTLICSTSSNLCSCEETKYYDPDRAQCVNPGGICESCAMSTNDTCLGSLYCDAGTCVCPIGKRWLPARSICVAIK